MTNEIDQNMTFDLYKGKDLFLISALDSLGVPYTPDNIEMKCFADLIKDKFIEAGANIKYINMCNLARNKTWELQSYLQRNETKGEIYRLHKEFARIVTTDTRPEARFGHPVNPNFVNSYYADSNNLEIKVTTTLKEIENTIFLYTCGGMDIDYYFKMPSCNWRLITKEMLFNSADHFKKAMDNIQNSLEQISKINEKTQIYVLGSYSMIEQKSIREIAQPLYIYYNKKLKKICSQFENVHYVDIYGTKDFIAPYDNHPTFKGQQFIAQAIINTMANVTDNTKIKTLKK